MYIMANFDFRKFFLLSFNLLPVHISASGNVVFGITSCAYNLVMKLILNCFQVPTLIIIMYPDLHQIQSIMV